MEVGSTLGSHVLRRNMVMDAHVMCFVFMHAITCIHNLKPGVALMSRVIYLHATTSNLPLKIAFSSLFLYINTLILHNPLLIVAIVINLDIEYEHLISYFLGRIQAFIECYCGFPVLVKQLEVIDGFHVSLLLFILLISLTVILMVFIYLSILSVHGHRLVQIIRLLGYIG